MNKCLILNIVGLSGSLINENTPYLYQLSTKGAMLPIKAITPAVTCTMQSTMLTGKMPKDHGIVANGWYFRNLSEIFFWRQSNHLVESEKLWETAKKHNPQITCSNMFWWYNMYSSVDYSATPRPIYLADGRKLAATYSFPPQLSNDLANQLGTFPLFNFWGPAAGIQSSQWIAEAAIYVQKRFQPTISLVYLPHLDYSLQKFGPEHPFIKDELQKVDKIASHLIESSKQQGYQIIVLSEYGITPVSNPIHINRIFRQEGFLSIRKELDFEALDPGASRAFAVSDHQIAHIYIKNSKDINAVKGLLNSIDGIEIILDSKEQEQWGLNHKRSGELIAIANNNSWFTYYYWLNDNKAPDYSRTVDIHRKPGYDPVELFINPKIPMAKIKIASKVLKKKLGFRMLMDVIPLDANLVKGSHGRVTDSLKDGPVLISSEADKLPNADYLHATDIKGVLLKHIF
ncbi:MAG: alkaline phosphatase family protein [Bdellovibrionota bacterium]